MITSGKWACIAYGHLYGLLNSTKRLSPVSLWQTTLNSKQLKHPKILERSKRYLSKCEPSLSNSLASGKIFPIFFEFCFPVWLLQVYAKNVSNWNCFYQFLFFVKVTISLMVTLLITKQTSLLYWLLGSY